VLAGASSGPSSIGTPSNPSAPVLVDVVWVAVLDESLLELLEPLGLLEELDELEELLLPQPTTTRAPINSATMTRSLRRTRR
jgi:hypothetical protein